MTLNPDIMLWKLKADAERARAEAAEKRVKTLELAIENYLENWEDEGRAKLFRAALGAKP